MPTLLDETVSRLANAPAHLSLTQIAKEAGLQLSWLSDFARGRINDPGVTKVQALHDYLGSVSVYAPETLPALKYKDIPEVPHLGAVYEYWSKGVCVYIGQTGKLGCRLREHARWKELYSHSKLEIRITYVDGNAAKRLVIEAQKIKAYQPLLNKRGK